MKKEVNLTPLRHSLAHLLAAAVQELYPEALPTLGPAIDNGFYYDFDNLKITDADLPPLETKMRELGKSWRHFSHQVVSETEAKAIYSANPYKLELIEEIIDKGEVITLYTAGHFTDLCRGGHVEDFSQVDLAGFKLERIAGAYWRGDENNKMLTRIYGLAFGSAADLQNYLTLREEAEKRDHRKLGKELDLFTFSELVGSGLPLWTPRGTIVRELLDQFVWQLRHKHGYEKVAIPHITKKNLYETSGHWAKYANDLFKVTTREDRLYALKPMNCPHHTQIYARNQRSYRELPIRYAETTMVYRDEQSGELSGLTRVLSITQDDAHVFCRTTQMREEMAKIWEIITEFYGAFGFKLSPRLSLHDPEKTENYLGDKARWQQAENELRALVRDKGVEAAEALGEAAFYGPKIDFISADSLGRTWQVATIQLDMNMPERFDLTCINEKGEKERIVMIHAAIMGSLERFLAILIEHLGGHFPTWLAPVQVGILPVVHSYTDYATKVEAELKQAGIRTKLYEADETLGKRIRTVKIEKLPYFLVLGDKEANSHTLTVEHRSGDKQELSLTDFLANLNQEITARAK